YSFRWVLHLKTLLISLFFTLFSTFLQADFNDSSSDGLVEQNANVTVARKMTNYEREEAQKVKAEVDLINEKLLEIDQSLKRDIWYTKYNNHQIYVDIENDLSIIEDQIKKIDPKKDSTKFLEYSRQDKALLNQLELLSDFKTPPFEELIKPQDLIAAPEINNPFHIFNGFTYLKSMRNKKNEFQKNITSLESLIKKLEEKARYAKRLNQIFGGNYNAHRIEKLESELDEIIATHDIATNTYKLYAKKIDDTILKTTTDIKEQVKRLFNISIIILVIVLFSFLFKYLAKKTISDNERYYMANKGINFTNFVLIVMVLIFSFLENVSYFVTVIGFASAGLAFAMKDLFMSALGWMVIVFGGSFHVGDRIRVMKNGLEYVGDIVDISILRMTILEDVTLTTYMANRRAGRIVFVPNNYIFTDLLANYTHGKIKTVWDGVDFTITFDSNYKKTTHLVKEIVKKYSKGYTDISRKQLNMLRSQYSLKNINVEPRIYTFMEENGIKISCWYMTNSYATLTLRSNIFANIIDAINEEDDIKFAYPTQIVNIKKDQHLPPRGESEEGIL
ncbi:MAG: mechanosensitive ion channel family protein, partial [Epsilonproteobacteria bacterium]|nr:mechanosensitive ion channel family protein [Campylobacterota bacterium]